MAPHQVGFAPIEGCGDDGARDRGGSGDARRRIPRVFSSADFYLIAVQISSRTLCTDMTVSLAQNRSLRFVLIRTGDTFFVFIVNVLRLMALV